MAMSERCDGCASVAFKNDVESLPLGAFAASATVVQFALHLSVDVLGVVAVAADASLGERFVIQDAGVLAAAVVIVRVVPHTDPADLRLDGDTVDMARRIVRLPGLTIGTGETTVLVSNGGFGGRNQHGALAAAIAIDGTEAILGTFGTDGVDGPTDAAGAIVSR